MKTERVEARLSPRERRRIDQAAALEGQSVSAFIVAAAGEKAEQVISVRATTVVPSGYFDRLLSAIDHAGAAPRLARAAKRARQRRRIR
ncbi:MAG: DUF1778 domain-containing protein [Acidobacteria bacterium]|nr:DUF1778 domain-containing protein [Acidobacteriota bacterium]